MEKSKEISQAKGEEESKCNSIPFGKKDRAKVGCTKCCK